jgi:iron(III) transport system ATP-binding protein
MAATIAADVRLDHVCKSFGGLRALDRVSLTVGAGEVLCLLGPSGCGKSTLLRVIAGVDEPDAGEIAIGGAVVASPKRFLPPERRGVGLMFQDYTLFPHLTVIENVAYGLTRLGRAVARREAQSALDRIGLGNRGQCYPHMLSGGQQQRVALARALAPRPAVLLMDEPFSGLDAQLREEIREDTIAILREARATAIIVTHDPEEAMHLGDRIAVMSQGRLLQAGTAEELYTAPRALFVAQTLSEVSVFPCKVRSGRAATALGVFPAFGVRDGAATLCVKQSAVVIEPATREGLPGRVLDMRFLGSHVLYHVAVAGLDAPLKVKICGAAAVKPGDDVCLHLQPGAVTVFGEAA